MDILESRYNKKVKEFEDKFLNGQYDPIFQVSENEVKMRLTIMLIEFIFDLKIENLTYSHTPKKVGIHQLTETIMENLVETGKDLGYAAQFNSRWFNYFQKHCWKQTMDFYNYLENNEMNEELATLLFKLAMEKRDSLDKQREERFVVFVDGYRKSTIAVYCNKDLELISINSELIDVSSYEFSDNDRYSVSYGIFKSLKEKYDVEFSDETLTKKIEKTVDEIKSIVDEILFGGEF